VRSFSVAATRTRRHLADLKGRGCGRQFSARRRGGHSYITDAVCGFYANLLLLCRGHLLGRAFLAPPVTLRRRLKANTAVVSHLYAVLTAHDVASILTHGAVFVPRLLVVFIFLLVDLLDMSWSFDDLLLLFRFSSVVIVFFYADHFTVLNFLSSASAGFRA